MEKDWKMRKLRPDVLDELLEQQHGREVPQILYALEEEKEKMLKLVSSLPSNQQAKGIVSIIVGLLYPNDREVCLGLLDSARKFVEEYTKEE